jgi:hypothetical protein
MFCIICKKGFDWKTGNIISENIHNPEYSDYLKKLNISQVSCNEYNIQLIPFTFVNTLKKLKFPNNYFNYFQDLIKIYFNNNIKLQQYRTNTFNNNIHIRIKYMLNKINEKSFKNQLQIKEKARLKKQDIFMILELYQHIIYDILLKIYYLKKYDESIITNFYNEINNLIKYCNENLLKIKNIYNCIVPTIINNGYIK